DIPASRLPGLIEAAGDHPVKVATVGFTPPTYNRGWSNGYPIPDVAKIQRAVHRLTSQAAATTPTTRADPQGLGGAAPRARGAPPPPPGPRPPPAAPPRGAARPAPPPADPATTLQACTATAGRSPAAPSRCTCPAGNSVLAPAFQVVRRPVVQIVGSRHSSLRDPSTTVSAAPAPRWPGGAVTLPARPPSTHAPASGAM